MRKNTIIVPLLSLTLLASCSGSISNDSTDLDLSTSISGSDVSISIDEQPSVSIAEVRNGVSGESYTIEGVLFAYNYTGQQTPYITGFWMADDSGSIYIYNQEVAATVEQGNKIKLTGTLTYYIPSTDASSAVVANYQGMIQLISPIVLSNDYGSHDIPSSAINDETIAEINQIPLTSNITGNIYMVKGHYHKYVNTGFTNYSIDDLNREDSLLAYTQSNGMDYAWTDAYDGKTVEMLLIVSIGKPSVGLWRMCPIEFISDDIVVGDAEEAEYAAERALKKFNATYDTDTRVTVSINDELFPSASLSFSSVATGIVSISSDTTNWYIDIITGQVGSYIINATGKVNSSEITKSKSFEITVQTHFETITIAEALQENDGTSVCVEAIIARITYRGSMVKQGMFIVDDSGTAFVYNDSATQINLADLVNGNKVIITGDITHYIKDQNNAIAENYSGDLQIGNVIVNHVDTNVYEVPTNHFINSSVETIATILPSTNITGNIYQVAGTLLINDYGGYSLSGLSDSSKTLAFYSQNSGADFASMLSSYANKKISVYVGIQNLNLRAAGSNWRACPIQFIEEIVS